MKVIVISDSHGNIANLKHVIGFAKKIDAKAVIHCGDWNNVEAVDVARSSDIPLYSILGNADIDPEIGKKIKRVYLEFRFGGKKIGIAHKIEDLELVDNDLDIAFCGDEHRQYEKVVNGVRVVNPGALENGINFAVYDTASDKIEFVNDES